MPTTGSTSTPPSGTPGGSRWPGSPTVPAVTSWWPRTHYGPRLAAILKEMGAEWTAVTTSPGTGNAASPEAVPESRHNMGTVRMGTDPATSVVDPYRAPAPGRQRGGGRLVGLRHLGRLRPDPHPGRPGRPGRPSDGLTPGRPGRRRPVGPRSARAAGEQQRAGDGTAAVADRGHLGQGVPRPEHLAVPALAPELDAGLVDEAEPVQPAARQLAAGGVEREHARRGRWPSPPSTKGPLSPRPQKPRASSHTMARMEKPS